MGRWPESVSWFPKPRLPLFALKEVVAWLGTLSTPGSSVARVVQSRPFKGSSRTVLESTVELTAEVAVCTSGGVLITSTTSETFPGLREMLRACCAPTVSTIPFCRVVVNCLAATLTS